jgi:ABC-2 type transport system permease protein
LAATLAYGGVWLGVAMVFSVIFRQPATAALAAIAAWLFFPLFWGIVSGLLAQTFGNPTPDSLQGVIAQASLEQGLSRISPNTLWSEVVVGMLHPEVRSLGLVLPVQLYRAVLGAPLPFGESLGLIWPQLTGLVAGVILMFALAYMLFQRQEVRA